ncbi:MAG: DUF3048 domain-containing protein [Anaerolineales bacterium]|nr:DUF3048 domain-containing protein [Anaerolineales bacterium]
MLLKERALFISLSLVFMCGLLIAGCETVGGGIQEPVSTQFLEEEVAPHAEEEAEKTATFTIEPDEDMRESEGEKDETTPTTTPTITPTVTSTPVPGSGAINPLTGLEVINPLTLCQRPLLVSISNFPVSSRPQAGLSVAAQVWETFIGEGMTRYVAVYYGDYVQYLEQIFQNRLADGSEEGFVIGPVRSGRVVFEDIKTLFLGARLITAGASGEVARQLTNRSSVYGSDPDDINSAGVVLSDIFGDEGCHIDPEKYATLVFDPSPPPGGEEAGFLRIVYNYLNQVGWEYDPTRGAYLRSQDTADGTGELFPVVEGLTGEQLAFENVVILWAQHRYVNLTIIEVELLYVRDRKGMLLRDGRLYDVKWSSQSGKFTIHDKDGNPIPLKPGATFFEVVSWETTWNAEERIVRYHNPVMPW